MDSSVIEVVAPSRLHFGLLSFGRPGERQFGGVGAMIDQPGLRLRISPHERFLASGLLVERTRAFVQTIMHRQQHSALPACHIEVLSAPADHIGLGTGTQLALAIAAGLGVLSGEDRLDPRRLAEATGRAERSAIGTYGFVQGGLLFEEGKLAVEPISPSVERVELCETWRFVLVIPESERGLAGEQERRAFQELPPVSKLVSDQLRSEVVDRLLPAARAKDFGAVGESLYRYGYQAGMCFAPRQGGPFASPRIAAIVEKLRSLGVAGAGQSSWGPTVFGLVENQSDAQRLCGRLAVELDMPPQQLVIAKPNRTGATIRSAPVQAKRA